MPAMFTRDKDAVASSAFVADLAVWCREQGRGILELLMQLFQRFGYYEEAAHSLTLQGRSGVERIAAVMQALRRSPPERLGGLAVRTVADLKTGEVRELGSGKAVGRYDVPASDVVVLQLADGTKAIVRPSGTEPKVKFYVLTREAGGDLGAARSAAGRRIQAVLDDLMSQEPIP
jgi:phosphoglucomutase